jgi:hypothetical protein
MLHTVRGDEKVIDGAQLFMDSDGFWRDRYIEHLFEDCFYGRELDSIFTENMRAYFSFLTKNNHKIPDNVFTNAAAAKRWIEKHFGHVEVTDDFDTSDSDLAHCTHYAILHSFANPDNDEACYAPSELHALLLSVVHLFRHIALQYTNAHLSSANKLPA